MTHPYRSRYTQCRRGRAWLPCPREDFHVAALPFADYAIEQHATVQVDRDAHRATVARVRVNLPRRVGHKQFRLRGAPNHNWLPRHAGTAPIAPRNVPPIKPKLPRPDGNTSDSHTAHAPARRGGERLRRDCAFTKPGNFS